MSLSVRGVRREVESIKTVLDGDFREAVKAALQNELLTRRRVEALEAVMTRGLWGRLKWLLAGK